MNQREKDLLKLKNMNNGETIYLNWFEEGGAIVIKNNNNYELFESPQYGGGERYEETFIIDKLDELLDIVYNWT